MKILALETSEMAGSLAAFVDGQLLLEMPLNSLRRSAQSLAPGIRELMDRVGWRTVDLGLVAVGIGPGSFTGVRVGVASAKVLAYAAGSEVLGVETLETIATGCPAGVERVSVVVDAQRGDVVVQQFRRQPDGAFVADEPWQLRSIEAWLAGLPAGICVTGPVLRKLADRLPSHVTALAPTCWSPRAETVGRLAFQQYTAGHRGDVWKLLPIYFRRSAAEETWDAKEASRSGA